MFFLQQKNQAAHYFFRKKSRASLFLQENIEHIIISTDKNEALHYFFRKKRSTSLFSESNQAFHYFFNNKKLIFFWRNNEVIGLVTSIILLMLFLQWKNQAPHYFFRTKMLRSNEALGLVTS